MSRASELADSLIGTADDADDELFALTEAESDEFDEIAFQCEGCGWWFAAADREDANDGSFCGECANDVKD